MHKIILGLLILINVHYVQPNQADTKKSFIYGQYNYSTVINVLVSNDTEQILDFFEDSAALQMFPTRLRVSTESSVPVDHPVFVTAQQQKGISSWELPMVVETEDSASLYNKMERTLCPHDAGPDIKTERSPTIRITTQNPRNTSVDIELWRVTDFYVELNKSISLNVTPSAPEYFFFSFDKNPWNATEQQLQGLPIFNYTIPQTVILIVESDDELCATVSIQNNSCPVFDSEHEIMYQGDHLTMTSKGGITLSQSKFPRGFYVVFAVKESDECTGTSASETEHTLLHEREREANTARMKSFRFVVVATISWREYLVGGAALAAVAVLVAAFVALVAVPFRTMHQEELLIEDESVPSTSQAEVSSPLIAAGAGAGAGEGVGAPGEAGDSEEITWSSPKYLTVARLTRASPDSLARRSERYFWGALTVAVVYSLPVVQLLFTYQQMVFQTGNQDLCYYNFLCAHPLATLSDFNHVYSNIAYVILGAAFALQVRARQRRGHGARQDCGIPQHYGLLYSMALALSMEGFLSACYHLCPNKMNFQFDSSFMYVIAVLVMIKLYQNRHSDLIPSAHSTFMLIALIMSIGLCGILLPSVWFQVFFTSLHLLTCLIITLKIYYAGQFQMNVTAVKRLWQSRARGAGWRALVPAHTARAALLALANLANWALAVYDALTHNVDFARQLLAILMGNAILYTWFYTAMKLVHRERLVPHARVYFLGAHVAWFLALHQFLHSRTKWSETPAMSRRYNAECTSLYMFDSHDNWHIASATAMFLSFNLLLTADDDRVNTPHTDIATF